MVKHWRLKSLKASVEHFFLVSWLGFAPNQMDFRCLIPPEMQYVIFHWTYHWKIRRKVSIV